MGASAAGPALVQHPSSLTAAMSNEGTNSKRNTSLKRLAGCLTLFSVASRAVVPSNAPTSTAAGQGRQSPWVGYLVDGMSSESRGIWQRPWERRRREILPIGGILGCVAVLVVLDSFYDGAAQAEGGKPATRQDPGRLRVTLPTACTPLNIRFLDVKRSAACGEEGQPGSDAEFTHISLRRPDHIHGSIITRTLYFVQEFSLSTPQSCRLFSCCSLHQTTTVTVNSPASLRDRCTRAQLG
jgi:hypothetical protein